MLGPRKGLVLLACVVSLAGARAAGAGERSTPLPVRAAFYYPWYPESEGWRSRFHPELGRYRSDDRSVVARHVRMLTYAGFDAALSSWWGRGRGTDRRFPLLLRTTAALRSPLKWALYYEPESLGHPSVGRLRADLRYFLARYVRRRSYLWVAGRPVIFVFGDIHDRCGMARRWKRASRGRFYVSLTTFPGYRRCPMQPDAWHHYLPRPVHREPGRSFTVSPGFWRFDRRKPRLARIPVRFRGNIRAMVAAGDPWQLVTSFNEWGEATAVEPAREWRSPSGYGTYLDILAQELPHR